MAITDYKITDNEINTYNVKSAPNTLKANAQSNKNWFDRLGEYFISKYNSLIDFIQGDFVNVDEVGAGLTYENNLEWKHALHKNTMIANYSGNITAITTGYRTIIANATGLTTYDFMDCIMNINGTDYQCADAYESGDYVTTTCDVEGVEVTITYSLSGGDITLTHTQNPLDTLYWNIQMFSTVADKIPAKSLPGNITNNAYIEVTQNGKWHGVNLEKNLETEELTKVSTFALPEGTSHYEYFDKPPIEGTTVVISHTVNTHTYTARITVGDEEYVDLYPYSLNVGLQYSNGVPVAVDFDPNENIESDTYTISYVVEVDRTNNYMPVMDTLGSNTAYLSDFAKLLANNIIVERVKVAAVRTVAAGNTATNSASVEKTGYTAIGIVGTLIERIEREGETPGHGVSLTRFYVVNDVGYWRLFNGDSADRTVNVYFDVLYIKNA